MARERVRVVLLCEDDEHRRFAHHASRKLGRHYRELRLLVSPTGRGAAESWVRKRYAEEVLIHRRRASSQGGLALVVVIDADRQTVDRRHQQLAAALKQSGIEERRPSEKIVIWVPKRHIETWVTDLLQGNSNEHDDYKNVMRDVDYQPAAERFVEQYRNPSSRPPGLLPSMSRAFDETARLPT